LLLPALLSGLALGSMYGLLALGFHVTHVVSGTVNFAQGSAMMLAAVAAYGLVVTLHWPWPAAIPVVLAGALFYGLAVEFLAVRPFARRGSSSWLIATVALGIVVDNAVLFVFGKEPRSLPSSLAVSPLHAGEASLGIYPLQALIPVAGLAIALALAWVARRTRLGIAMVAVVQNREAANLMGIDPARMIAGAYAISTALAAVAGMLIAPLVNVHSDMGTLFGLKAFAAAIVGGIGSAAGVMLAGLLLGVCEALVTAYLGSAYTQILTFALVIAVLAARPQGLLGRADVKKV
jgi:branched-chain amino acid transport system permease protein